MKRNDVIFIGLVLGLLIAVFFLIGYMKSQTAQCIKNPFIYGARNMGNVSCDCFQVKGNCFPKFSFTDNNITFKKVEC